MKVSQQTLKQITADFQKIYDERVSGISATIFAEKMKSDKIRLAWSFWHKIADDKQHNGDKSTRIFDYDPDFELYPDGTNDKTLRTALFKSLDSIKT